MTATFQTAAEATMQARTDWQNIPEHHRKGLRPAVFELADGRFQGGTWPSARADEIPESAYLIHP